MPKPLNLRDERGWRIPRRNTISWHLYTLTCFGLTSAMIADILCLNPSTVKVLIHRFKHPDAYRQRYYRKSKRAHQEEAKP